MPASTILQLRRDTAANWTSTNPVLAQGEIGYETDTGLFKVGNGTSGWASLSYGGLSGPQSTSVLESFGDGSDGNVTISSGVTTLVRDMFYNNLTMSGTGQINTAGFKIFVKGTLDISAAAVGAIFNNGGSGLNSTTQTGGSVGTVAPGVTASAAAASGTAGATGVIGGGVQGAISSAAQNGGDTRPAGASGSGTGGGGAVSRAGAVAANVFPIRRYETDLLRGVSLIVPGAGGPGGSSGAGDGVTVGNSCGGGGGGGGGGCVAIWANIINRGGSTPASCIQALGGMGGNGRSAQGIYTFTVASGNTIADGSTYTHNGNTYIVTANVTSAGITIPTITSSSGAPLTSGTLTLASGTGPATIAFSAVAASSSAAAALASIGGGGGGAGGSGGWIIIQYNSLTGSTATNCLDASGGPGGVGGNGAKNYTFTVTAGQTASVGATFTNNGNTFTVTTALLVAGTTLVTVGMADPTASGTLTKATGTSSGNITFSSFTNGIIFNTAGQGGTGGNGGRITLLQVTTSTGSDTFTGTATLASNANAWIATLFTAGGVNQVSL